VQPKIQKKIQKENKLHRLRARQNEVPPGPNPEPKWEEQPKADRIVRSPAGNLMKSSDLEKLNESRLGVPPTITPSQPTVELKQYDIEKIQIQPFDESMVMYMKTMQEQNNVYAGLRQQEENIRVNLNTLRSAIHDLKAMRQEELRSIFIPYLNGLRQITPERRDEFIRSNISMYRNFDIQYKSIQGQRANRADELGEARLRVLKRLWDVMISEHGFKQDDLIELVDHESWGKLQAMVRPKIELPTIETVK